ncbi:HpcH/HpaI aldolase/citrate lyase family protein [Chloroflexota bacterium]
MRKNQAKEKLINGGTIYGVFCNFYSPMIVELIGHIGFDFVLVDAEHGPAEVESCEHMVRAAESAGIPIFIRVAMNIRQNILRYLDIGAQGVQLPMVNTRTEAEAVVQAVKYPPQGRRGLAAMRAADYGLKMSLKDYARMANQEILVVVQIETVEAMNNLDELLTVEGIDVFFIGPTDLSTSMGYVGQANHPEVQATIERLVREIHAAGKVAGTVAYDNEALTKAKERGFQYVVHNVIPMMAKSGREYLVLARDC